MHADSAFVPVCLSYRSWLSGVQKRNARQRLLRQTGIGLLPTALATLQLVAYRSKSGSERAVQYLLLELKLIGREKQVAGAVLHLVWRCHMARPLESLYRRGEQSNGVDNPLLQFAAHELQVLIAFALCRCAQRP